MKDALPEVLILGNGISRLPLEKQIRAYPGEVWGCNAAYLDFPGRLDRLYGEVASLKQAAEYKREHPEEHFRIIAPEFLQIPESEPLTCLKKYHHDSGTTLIAEALTRGYRIAACGFDLGGPEIHVVGSEKIDKSPWVNRWRVILKDFGADRVRFVGYDHLPFLLGDVSPRVYADKYLSGRPHIENQSYRELFKKWTKLYPAEKKRAVEIGEVLILGNGISRLAYDSLIRSWPGEVWACNKAYLDYPGKITRLTGHKEVMQDAVEFRKTHGLQYQIWANNLGNFDFADRDFDCPADMKRDSGTTLAAQALYEGRNIALCGIDLGGPDIHSPGNEKRAKHNWISRWRKIIEVFGKDRIRFIGHDHMPYLMSGKAPSEYSRRYMQEKPHIPNEEYFDVWEKWAGKPAVPFKESQMVRVRYKDGREAEMNDFIAAKMERKGKIMIIKEGQTIHAGREKFTGEISEAKAAELGITPAPVASAVAVAERPEPIPEPIPEPQPEPVKKKPAFSPRGGRGRSKK